MFEVTVNEFPFVADIPKREKSKLQTVWDRLGELKRAQEEHGILIPCRMAAQLLDVSHQRICQLLDAGRLQRVEIGSLVFVTENSLVELAKSERKSGRPFKTPQNLRDVLGVAKRVYRDTTDSLKK